MDPLRVTVAQPNCLPEFAKQIKAEITIAFLTQILGQGQLSNCPEFILAGGGLFNNLDYSFTVGHEDGTFKYPPTQPGGGSPAFRKQIKLLKDFIHSFDFVRMKPARDAIREPLPKDAQCQILAEPGRQYAAYFRGAAKFEFTLDFPAGNYHVRWIDVVSGLEEAPTTTTHPGGPARFVVPDDLKECAVRIVRETR